MQQIKRNRNRIAKLRNERHPRFHERSPFRTHLFKKCPHSVTLTENSASMFILKLALMDQPTTAATFNIHPHMEST